MAKPLAGKICLVTGATRGIGKGIALQLSEAGATVYITGRTLKKPEGKIGGSLEETVQEVDKRGGVCIPIQCDHSDDAQVAAVFDKINRDRDGQLDLLVNNAYAAVDAITSSIHLAFWEQDKGMWDIVNNVGLRNHYMCTLHATRMMVPRKQGLIVNVSSMGGLTYLFNIPYGVGKMALDRMTADCAVELRKYNIAMVSLWPGPVKTEKIMNFLKEKPEAADNFPGVHAAGEAFLAGESMEFSGICIVRLIQDRNLMKKTGKILLNSDLGDQYKLKDIEGDAVTSQRAVSGLLYQLGWVKTSKLIPDCVKLPLVCLHMASYKF